MDPSANATPPHGRTASWSLWLAIGVLIAAAVMGSIFIIFGDQSGVAGRAWLALVLTASFAGAVVLDAAVSHGPNRWYLPVSIGVNAVLLGIGQLKVWGGFLQFSDTTEAYIWAAQTFLFFWIVTMVRVAMIITQTYGLRFVTRSTQPVSRVFAIAALIGLWLTTFLLGVPASLPEPTWPDWWWRLAGAGAIVTVACLLVPVIMLAFQPKAPKPAVRPYYGAPAQPPVHPVGYPAPQYPAQQGGWQQPPAFPASTPAGRQLTDAHGAETGQGRV